MRMVVLYHPKSDHAARVLDYAHDYKRFRGREMKLVSLETKDGDKLARLYDVIRYPAILVLDKDGRLLRLWQGGLLPRMNDLDTYLQE